MQALLLRSDYGALYAFGIPFNARAVAAKVVGEPSADTEQMAGHANLGLRSISVERVLYLANLLSQLRQADL